MKGSGRREIEVDIDRPVVLFVYDIESHMTPPTATSDARIQKGRQTRHTILQLATQIASAEGLEGLSLGRLAAEIGMSKSGLFAHFRSKEDLQLAVIDYARALFIQEVVLPAEAAGHGICRLGRLVETWLSYAQRNVFRGGCFFFAASMEFDNRPGPVRERIRELMAQWLKLLETEFRQAKDRGEIRPEADEGQLAFEFNAQIMCANWANQLLDDGQSLSRARTAILERLRSFACAGTVLPPLAGSALKPGEQPA